VWTLADESVPRANRGISVGADEPVGRAIDGTQRSCQTLATCAHRASET
jgi:hypothetical protein